MFLNHVGPIALDHMKKFRPLKSRGGAGKGRKRRIAKVAPLEHVVAMDGNARPNAFIKALGNWIGRATQTALRKAS